MGPFQLEAGADFLARLHEERGPIPKALRRAASTANDAYLDVDDGSAAWVACELVALSFGRGDLAAVPPSAFGVLLRLKPTEKNRQLALQALTRLAGAQSEVVDLVGESFVAIHADLRARLEAASAGPIPLPIAKRGDVIALEDPALAPRFVVIQVLAAREIAVLLGTFADDEEALRAVGTTKFQRVLAHSTRLRLGGRLLGNVALRAELKKKQLYAHESGALEYYYLATAGGRLENAPWEEARSYPVARVHGRAAIVRIAKGELGVVFPRAPDEHEAAILAQHAQEWERRRMETTPGPFGDASIVGDLASWVRTVDFDHRSTGIMCYVRPREGEERLAYAYAALVAIWRGQWPADEWPMAVVGPIPEPPRGEALEHASETARKIAAGVITRDSALRLIWDHTPEGAAELRRIVELLQRALA